jgi:hypothetical protein
LWQQWLPNHQQHALSEAQQSVIELEQQSTALQCSTQCCLPIRHLEPCNAVQHGSSTLLAYAHAPARPETTLLLWLQLRVLSRKQLQLALNGSIAQADSVTIPAAVNVCSGSDGHPRRCSLARLTRSPTQQQGHICQSVSTRGTKAPLHTTLCMKCTMRWW